MKTRFLLPALIAGLALTAALLAHRQIKNPVLPSPLPASSGPTNSHSTHPDLSPEGRRHRETAITAKAILKASQGRESSLPDLSLLGTAELEDLLSALGPVLSDQPPSRRIFCYQTVLSALQSHDPQAGLASLEQLRSLLAENESASVWPQVAEIYFSSTPPADVPLSASWLSVHRNLFPDASSAPDTSYQEMAKILSLCAARQDLDAGLRTSLTLALPKEDFLPALAQEIDSPENWSRIVTELHSGSRDGDEPSDASVAVLSAANAKVGQMSAGEGMAWLDAVSFPSEDLVQILETMEAGPLQDPQPWLAWMKNRLTPDQAAAVRTEWSRRFPSIAGPAGN